MHSNDFSMTRRKFLAAGAAFGAATMAPRIANSLAALDSSVAPQSPGAETPAKKYQAKAPKTHPFGAEAFEAIHDSTIRWLGSAGFFINSRGTTLMIDPLLEGFDMPVMIDMPIMPKNVPHLDAVLITHSDNDHYSIPTCRDVASVTRSYHSTQYVASLMEKERLPAFGHEIGDSFNVGHTKVTLTPADHDWQNSFPEMHLRHFEKKDCCGFWIDTPDGTIWASGDSRPMSQLLEMPQMDAILLDYSEDAQFHFGLEGNVKIANAYPGTPVILGHWGSVDAPDFAPFNGDPQHLISRVVNPDRIQVLAPGQAFRLKRIKKA
jgi:L-ascorbate metabolism protein UlaG (beta-lactamase superfamily)